MDGIILTGISWTKTLEKEDIAKIILDLDVFDNEFEEKEIGFKTKEVLELAYSTSEKIDIFCHTSEDNYMMEFLAKMTSLAMKNKIELFGNPKMVATTLFL